jgi:hypothetical protein
MLCTVLCVPPYIYDTDTTVVVLKTIYIVNSLGHMDGLRRNYF